MFLPKEIAAAWSPQTRCTQRQGSRVGTLVMHSEDGQIVPYIAAGPLSHELLENGAMKIYKSFPHGMPTTKAGTINSDLLAFIKS
jgi:non-heme chloroperoxidase